jgi:hypothetical protein
LQCMVGYTKEDEEAEVGEGRCVGDRIEAVIYVQADNYFI